MIRYQIPKLSMVYKSFYPTAATNVPSIVLVFVDQQRYGKKWFCPIEDHLLPAGDLQNDKLEVVSTRRNIQR
ncbi:MAG: hypothetical protein JW971_05505 [Synergistales bacterium]|nr:hypothetical protein [Synergistales bacterium]